MPTGTIARLLIDKGFGFIRDESGLEHFFHRSKHGHNSADALAVAVANRLRLPLAENLLVRTRATRPQTELTPTQRPANVRNAFAVRTHPDLPGANLLLIDDVLTTGSTVNEIAKTLLKAGASSVAVAVLARAVGGK